MAFVISNTGQSYANFASAFNALPSTFDADYTILADSGETTTSTPFTLTGKNTGTFNLILDFQDNTRELFNSSASANYVISIGINNVTVKNVTIKGSNYTGTSSRNIYISTNISNTNFENCVVKEGYNGFGHYSITGVQQIDGITFKNCSFTNFTNSSINIGSKTFAAGAYLTALDTDYQVKNVLIKGCNFQDTSSKGNVGTSTSKADLGIKVYATLGLTLEDNKVNGVGSTALDARYCKNVISKRWDCKDWAFNNLTSKQCFYFSNILNIDSNNSVLYTSTSSYFHIHFDTCKSIKFNHNTVYTSSGGDVFNMTNCLDIQEHEGGLYYSSTGKYTFNNATSGLTMSEIGVWDYNYYGFPGNAKVCDFTIGSTTYSIRHASYTGNTTWLATGKDANSIFVASGSTTDEKVEVFNKTTNTSKPYLSVLPNSLLYNKISGTKYGGSIDVRGWNKTGNYDIGTYDYDAIDPNATTNPPGLILGSDRTQALVDISTVNFTAVASPHDGATITGYLWDFGNGSTSNLQNPSYVFTSYGTKYVSCIVTDSNSLQTTELIGITVSAEGCEIIGGANNGKVYEGNNSLQNAINGAFNNAALTSNVTVNLYSTIAQNFIYYTGKDTSIYKLTLNGIAKNSIKSSIIPTSSQNGIWFQSGGNVLVKNIDIQGYSTTAAVRLDSVKGIRFYNCNLTKGLQPVQITDCDGISFDGCSIKDGTFYRLQMSSSRNIFFKSCTFDGTSFPANEFTLVPSVMGSTSNNYNVTFNKCIFNGRGNWSTGFKGSNNVNWTFNGCTFKHFIGRLFWFTGSNRGPGEYNAKYFKFYNNVFDEANLLDPAFYSSDFGTKANEASIMFDMDYCYDFEYYNNTFYQNMRGKNTGGSIFYGTFNTNNIKLNGNIFAILDTGTSTSGLYQIYNMGTNTDTTEKVAYSTDNVFIFENTNTNLLKYGKVGTVTYNTAANANGAQSNLEVNRYESRGANTFINVSTFELASATSPLPTAATNRTLYDFDGNQRSLNIGAKEYNKTAFENSSLRDLTDIKGINKNSNLPSPIYYSGLSNSVPSLDNINFYLDSFILNYADNIVWKIKDSSNTLIEQRRESGFTYYFPFTDVNKTYYVEVIAEFSSGTKDVIATYTVSKPRPVSGFSLSEYQTFKGGSVDFINESKYGVSYLWTIQKSGGSSENFTSFDITGKVFDTVGFYNVTLVATNEIDSSTMTYSKTLQVLDDLIYPYVNITAEKNTYYRNQRVKINVSIKFRKRFFRYKWMFYDSENISDTPVFVHEKENADFDASILPQGNYDVVFVATSPSGDIVRFFRRLISIYNTPLQVFDKNCTITDTYTRLNSSVSRTGTRIDGTSDNIQPGTQIRLTGTARGIYLSNIKGTLENPVTIVPNNIGSRFTVASSNDTAIYMAGCEHVKILGQQNPNNDKFGFDVFDYNGTCLFTFRAMELSTYITLSGCELRDVGFAAIQCKTEPDPTNYKTFRGYTQMENTYIHDNYIHGCLGEGLYIGFTSWGNANSYFGAPQVPDENGNTLAKLFGQYMINTKIYRNKLRNIGWDGIQVSNGVSGTEIHDNDLLNLGILEIFGQNSGMAINTGFDGLIYNNKLNKGITAFPYKRLWAFNNVFLNGSFYCITDNEDFWDEELPKTTGPYYGQYDGSRIFNNNKSDVRIFGNTFYAPGKIFTFNNKCTGGGSFKKFIIANNFVLSKKNSYYLIDPTVAPVSATTGTQTDIKLYLLYDNGFTQESTNHYILKSNVLRKDDSYDDCEMVNINKLQALISPNSILKQNPLVITDILSDITMNFWHGNLYDINGYKKNTIGGSNFTVGAYTFPDYLMTNDKYFNNYISTLKSEKEYADNMILEDRVIVQNIEDKVLHLHDNVKVGGFKTIKESTGVSGSFVIDNITFFIENGLIVNFTTS